MIKANDNIITAESNAIPRLAHHDAELIRACDEFCAAERHILALHSRNERREDERAREKLQAPYRGAQGRLLNVIADSDLRAKTPEGIKARARAALAWIDDISPPQNVSDEIVRCLLRDLVES